MKTVNVYDTTERIIEYICDKLEISECELMEEIFEGGYVEDYLADNELEIPDQLK